MNNNILKSSEVTKIYLFYNDGISNKRYSVKLRFIDKSECYFATDLPIQFKKPKKKNPVEVIVYTPDGIYKANLFILDTIVNLKEVLFQVTVPENWKYIQQRDGSRTPIDLPIQINFNDGYSIETTTNDISVRGVAFYQEKKMPEIYKKVPCKITVQFPEGVFIDKADGKLVKNAKFVREKLILEEYMNEYLYAFKYTDLSEFEANCIKKFLIELKDLSS